mmetsp:Transcript_23886/g.58543  ORF Transcript_23886/g.58543 Transcript_23886/m.58543 type:complete len:249 (+) Transcript_23886:245-991(+)
MGATPVPVPAPALLPFLLRPLTMSSMRSSMAALSTAVLMLCTLTAYASQIPSSFMSTMVPLLPSMPNVHALPPVFSSVASACLARSLVSVRMTLAPQFCASVRGITSSAMPMARKGSCSTPSILSASSAMALLMAISTAPPPGSSLGSCTTLRATPMASCRLRSTSFSTSRLAPRRMMLHALGSTQSTKNVKYSSPSFSTLNSPAPVPMSSSLSSSTRCTMVAPVARAMRLLSVLRTRRSAVMPALQK